LVKNRAIPLVETAVSLYSAVVPRGFSGIQIDPRVMKRETTMAWTTPTLVEICIGLEISGYLPAEF
jgi:PqqA family